MPEEEAEENHLTTLPAGIGLLPSGDCVEKFKVSTESMTISSTQEIFIRSNYQGGVWGSLPSSIGWNGNLSNEIGARGGLTPPLHPWKIR